MPKTKIKYYAVKRGRVPGIYKSWDEAKGMVNGFSGAVYKGFGTMEEAFEYMGEESRPQAGPSDTTRQRRERAVQSLVEETSGVHQEQDRKVIVVHTDGACSRNGTSMAMAGIGVWWGSDSERNLSERLPGAQTNNRAELYAIARMLEDLPDPKPNEKRRIVVRTDSKYCINVIQVWSRNWEVNDWRKSAGAQVSNAGLIQYLLSLLSLRSVCGDLVRFEHVKGHSGDVGNEQADRLAVEGCRGAFKAERDWTDARLRVEEDMRTRNVSRRPTKPQLEFTIVPEDLLSNEELLAMERTQEF